MNDGSSQKNISCENITDFKTNIYVPTYIIVFIFGFIENIFCLYVFLKLYKKKTVMSIVMVNLAISDLLFVCTLPWRVIYYWKRIWTLSDSFCEFLFYALYLNMYCSIYFLTLMSILRYFAIVHPIKCLKFRSVKYVQIICIAIWVFVGAVASPILRVSSKTNKTKCFELNNKPNISTMNLISLPVGFFLPFFIITVSYIFVVKTLLTSKPKHQKQMSSRRKAIAMIIIVMTIFLTSFLPYHILRTVYITTTSQASCFVHKSAVVTQCTAALNSCLNPLLYYFAAENFRDKLRNIVENSFRGCPTLMLET
ncbi:cysteinyl leukotriene receptor 2-like [Scyliorhinus canicula]|uniref:cysteinyl leukotriene receptor 2-like n=1 Tax=Scyliorhinus canicula TaxID=7830 RepID=UPI0018F5B370|nr:cysteinyl leukotriene receptor 2-like [Scyliorhinus canicula]